GWTGVAGAVGPLLGGFLVSAFSWRAVSLLNLPIGVAVVALAPRVPETRDPTAHGPLDIRGAVLGAISLAGITYALIEGPAKGLSAGIVVTAAVGVGGFFAFLIAERRERNPIVPPGMFASPQVTPADAVTSLVSAPLAA